MLTDLNQDQNQAVLDDSLVLVVLAGPGTGKTKTLVAKAQYLLTQQQVSSDQLCLISFTNKACQEISSRITKEYSPLVTTFHALALQILTSSGQEVKIAPPEMINQLASQVINELKTDQSVKDLLLEISYLKNTQTDLENLGLKLFTDSLERLKLMDFDDLLIQSIKVLEDQKLHQYWQQKCQYLFVDEFQDTSILQYQLIKMLRPDHLMVIGDPLQSIYSFRGADGNIFDQLSIDYPQLKQIRLSTHYRSRPEIISTALKLFTNPELLNSVKDQGGEIQIVTTFNQVSESKWTENKILELMGGSDLNNSIQNDQNLNFCDFAVIFRTRKLAQDFMSNFSQSGLPVQLIGELSPFLDPKVIMIISVFKFLVSGDLFELGLLKLTQKNLLRLSLLRSKETTFPLLVEEILEVLKIPKADRSLDLDFVLQTLSQFQDQKNYLQKMLKYYQQINGQEYFDTTVDKIAVMTIHSVKGLEFNTVFIGGFEQGLIPHQRAIENNQLDEEKRLLFVAMTRAKERLFLIKTQKRWGQKTITSTFEELIYDHCQHLIDQEITKILCRQKKRAEKNRQKSLF